MLIEAFNNWNSFYSQMSTTENFTRADFWNVFSVEALNRANVHDDFTKQHTVGRKDCATSPHEDSVVKQFEFNETTGEVTDACKKDSSSCSSNPDTASIIAEYIADDMKMANDFAKVFYKLLRKGYAEDDISEISHIQPAHTVDSLPASSSFIFDLFLVRVACWFLLLVSGCRLITMIQNPAAVQIPSSLNQFK